MSVDMIQPWTKVVVEHCTKICQVPTLIDDTPICSVCQYVLLNKMQKKVNHRGLFSTIWWYTYYTWQFSYLTLLDVVLAYHYAHQIGFAGKSTTLTFISIDLLLIIRIGNFPMMFPWSSHEFFIFPGDFPSSQHLQVIFPWFSHGFPMVFPWFSPFLVGIIPQKKPGCSQRPAAGPPRCQRPAPGAGSWPKRQNQWGKGTRWKAKPGGFILFTVIMCIYIYIYLSIYIYVSICIYI